MANPNQSPFAELSFTEQQEQWRVFRAQHLDFQEVAPKEEAAERPVSRAVPAYAAAPQHHNLDRVRAQLASASRRVGAFQPVPVKE